MSGAEGRRVVVGVSGSMGSLTALHRAVEEARRTGAELLTVLAWLPPDGEPAQRHVVSPPPIDFRRAAADRLLETIDAAFGGAGPGVPWQGMVARGHPGPALVESADRAGDVLVIGAGRRGGLRRLVFPSVVRYCVAHADCPVLAVPPSPLLNELTSVHRRLGRWLPFDARRLTEGTP
ncbi:Universal stress protein UspA-related nucleotide-binding protein [Streptomyces venezuelae]|uniref:universal stress protein n=1 Tax=Streptomyces gardneri TaxID=66892 RepID=UPI0006BC181C|nr:universal stress protein [Streptomyces gardneri]ALO06451.1 Universal stress protein UspA-related nucleotide-binding protein [Streptomyces venezuelae]QPK43891.1 universal stress protein [Streptomyces gardneri]WRK35152.1 universal stress protein [Streptomyces venezuelae]CUM43283.1 Universal stress protein family [Streptomyces venezuelae]